VNIATKSESGEPFGGGFSIAREEEGCGIQKKKEKLRLNPRHQTKRLRIGGRGRFSGKVQRGKHEGFSGKP